VDERLKGELELASLSDEDFVERAYGLLLRRPPDAAGRENMAADLRRREISRARALSDIMESQEFGRLLQLDDAVAAGEKARLRRRRLRGLTGPPASDERCVEMPWALSRYRGEQRVLDVGYAFALPAYLGALTRLGASRLIGVDLATAEVPGLEGVRADLRDLPFKDNDFELILCISTLEHVGYDNTDYGFDKEHDEMGVRDSLAELSRVLAPHGRLLITVPTGQEEDLGGFVQRPVPAWRSEFERAGLLISEEEVYELGPVGWSVLRAPADPRVRYGQAGPGAGAVLCAELRPRRFANRLRSLMSR
jgi:SAM-dependent methyltransferase